MIWSLMDGFHEFIATTFPAGLINDTGTVLSEPLNSEFDHLYIFPK